MLTETEQMLAIQRVLDGDIEDFAALVAMLQGSALRMAFAITGDRAAAEDVVQESFISAFRHLNRYDADRATFSAWFHAIVRNAGRNYLRHRKSRSENADTPPDSNEAACPRHTPDNALGLQEQMGSLDQAMSALPADWRRAFTLTEIEGVSYADAAVMEGVPIGTIRSRVHRSRKILQEALSNPSLPTPSDEALRF